MTTDVKNIYQAMNAIMSDCDGLTKDRTSQGGFKYRGIDDMYNLMHDIFVKHGVFSVPTVLDTTREERKSSQGKTLIYTLMNVMYTFYAVDGSSISAQVVGEAFDTGDKSASKALAIAHKYALFQVTMLPTMLSDPDAETHQIGNDQVGSEPETVALATKDQLSTIADYRKMGATTGEQNDWLDKHNGNLTERQAANIIRKLDGESK
jgi:hypothetical protein